VNYVGFYLIVSAKARHSGLVMPPMTPAVFTGNQDRFCRLAPLIFEPAVIDNQGETLLNGNT
jgi:hypothetical protein